MPNHLDPALRREQEKAPLRAHSLSTKRQATLICWYCSHNRAVSAIDMGDFDGNATGQRRALCTASFGIAMSNGAIGQNACRQFFSC